VDCLRRDIARRSLKKFLDHRRGPRPRKLVGIGEESLDKPDPLVDGVVREVAAQLLISPTVEHLLNSVRLGVKQWNGVDDVETATLVDGQTGLQWSRLMIH
jgi:hypothetical protein